MKLEKFKNLLKESQKESIENLRSFFKFFIIAEIIIFSLLIISGDFFYNSETKTDSFLGPMLLIIAAILVVILLIIFFSSFSVEIHLNNYFISKHIPLINGEDLISNLENKEIICQYSNYNLASEVGQVFLLKNNDLVRYKGIIDIIKSEKYIDYASCINRSDKNIV